MKKIPKIPTEKLVNPAHPRAKARGFVEGLRNMLHIPQLKSEAFRMGGVKALKEAKLKNSLLFEYGALDDGTVWIRLPSKNLLHVDKFTLDVLLDLNDGTIVDEVCKKHDLSEEDLAKTVQKLAIYGGVAGEGKGKIAKIASQKDIKIWPYILALLMLIPFQVLYFMNVAHTHAVRTRFDAILVTAIGFLAVLLHEAGHYFASRPYFKPPKWGITFFLCFPMAYVETHPAWCFPRNIRLRINAAGVFVDLVVNTIAAAIVVFNPALEYYITPFLMLQYLRLIFVLNPLIPSDIYWIISDLTKIVNLRKRAFENLSKLKFNLLSLFGLLSILFILLGLCLFGGFIIKFIGRLIFGRPNFP